MICSNCNSENPLGSKFCGFCGEKIVSENSFQIAKNASIFLKKIDWRRFLFNKYTTILAGVIFISWIASSDGVSNSGTRAPLPPPIQGISNNVDTSALLTPAVSLANGAVLKRNTAYLNGYGKLVIKNGTNSDAVAKLIRGGASVLTVYIKANSNYSMVDISDGVYWLAFTQGLDWNSTTQKFRRSVQYSAFDETFNFITTEDDQYYYGGGFEITLHPVIGGTAETSNVNPEQFNAY